MGILPAALGKGAMDDNLAADQPVLPFQLREPVSILMPVCNEADIIEDVIEEWFTDVIRFLPEGSEMILDDCSTDGTELRLKELARKYPVIRLNFTKRDGFFNSAMRLYRLSRCPLVFFTDSDGQYVPAEFWKVAAQIDQCDMAHGAKVNRKDPFYRIHASYVFNALMRRWFGSACIDVNSAFRLIRRPVLTAVLDEIRHMRMLPNSELYLRAEAKGFKIRNVLVSHRPRKYAKSRSLPLRSFAPECWRAYIGARNLRNEIALARSAKAAAKSTLSREREA
jgi:dolichol-phosphate mannosyltransferase